MKSRIRNQKSKISYILLFLVMIALGSALALYADSPLLVVPFLGVLVLTSFAALEYALYILVAFLPFSFRFIMLSGTEMQVPTEPLLAIMAIALALRWIILGARKPENRKARQPDRRPSDPPAFRLSGSPAFPFRFPMLVYGVSLCLSMINAGHLYSAVKGSLRAVAYIMLAAVVSNVITDKRRLKRLFIASIVPSTVAVGWTVIFLADRLEMWRWSSAYEGLPFTSYSHYGSFVAVILLLFLARSRASSHSLSPSRAQMPSVMPILLRTARASGWSAPRARRRPTTDTAASMTTAISCLRMGLPLV